MLTELRIRNFALIERLTVRLGPGLNVLTGETGAGKSIIVGALSLLLGDRASSGVVRAGEEKASVEGVFELEDRPDLRRWLEERGVEPEDGLLILKREVALEGRNRAWINGSPTTAALLGELGAALVSLHGQHEHQTLLQRTDQRTILDAFGGTDGVAMEVAASFRSLAEIRSEIENLDERKREAMQRADFLRFQLEEIDAARVDPDEEQRLDEEQSRLEHAEELTELSTTISQVLVEGDRSALSRVASVRRGLDQLVRIDASQQELSELYDTAYYTLEELGSRMQDYLLSIEHDPERLNEIRGRQDLLYRLKAKYGPTLEDVVETGEAARKELSALDEADWERSELVKRQEAAEKRLQALAVELTERRQAAARSLEAEVNRVLPELGMEGGQFAVRLIPTPETGAAGNEEIEFQVSLNRGFEPKPLAQVASGGELSRVMLALKTILARLDSVATLVFDEVDAGIGGRVALQVGDKMRQVAETHQVLSITHLPQIASRAHRHLLVRKDDGTERTSTTVVTLDAGDRVGEIARMLGGDPESDASLTHARELLDKGAAAVA